MSKLWNRPEGAVELRASTTLNRTPLASFPDFLHVRPQTSPRILLHACAPLCNGSAMHQPVCPPFPRTPPPKPKQTRPTPLFCLHAAAMCVCGGGWRSVGGFPGQLSHGSTARASDARGGLQQCLHRGMSCISVASAPHGSATAGRITPGECGSTVALWLWMSTLFLALVWVGPCANSGVSIVDSVVGRLHTRPCPWLTGRSRSTCERSRMWRAARSRRR
jgi:hypothetical protein